MTARDSTNGTQLWQNALPPDTTIGKLLVTETMVIGLVSTYPGPSTSFTTDIHLLAWRITDGALLWNAVVVQDDTPYPSLHESNLDLTGTLIVLHNQRDVQVFDAFSGTRLWQFTPVTASSPVFVQSVAVSATDIIIETTAFTMPGLAQLMDFALATGHQLWQATLGQFVAISPVMADGRYYVMDGTTLIARQAHTGVVLWQTPNPLAPSTSIEMYAVSDALTLIGPVPNSTAPQSFYPDLMLLVLDPATGQIRTQATQTHAESSQNDYESVGGKVWLEQGTSTFVVYDVHTATRLFTAKPLDGAASLRNVFVLTPDATIISFIYVNNGGGPIRYGQGLQVLDPNTGRVRWTYRHPFSF